MKGILFRSDMLQACIEGRKDVTRRLIPVQPPSPKYKMVRLIESTDRADRKHEGLSS